jgi:Cys-rich protein (TIGR01571 family)
MTAAPANIEQVKARISSKQPGKPWHQPLLNPLQDPVRCLLGYFCGVCMFGFNAAAVEGDDNWIMPCLFFYLSSCFCLQWYVGQPIRSKIRQKYGLEEAPYSDCISYTGLCCFAICQEAAEIEYQKGQNKHGDGKPTGPAGGAPPPHSAPPTTNAPPAQTM